MTEGQSTEYRKCRYCDEAFVVRYKDQRYCNKWHRKLARLNRVIENDNSSELVRAEERWKGYLKVNTMKYLWRYTYKGNALQDLRKAEFYLKKLIRAEERE